MDNNRWRYVTSATIYELKEKIILISHPFIIKYNDSKLCVIHIHNYLKYVLQILFTLKQQKITIFKFTETYFLFLLFQQRFGHKILFQVDNIRENIVLW